MCEVKQALQSGRKKAERGHMWEWRHMCSSFICVFKRRLVDQQNWPLAQRVIKKHIYMNIITVTTCDDCAVIWMNSLTVNGKSALSTLLLSGSWRFHPKRNSSEEMCLISWFIFNLIHEAAFKKGELHHRGFGNHVNFDTVEFWSVFRETNWPSWLF